VRNDKEAVDQTDAENRADLFRVHLLRGRGLTEEIAGSNDCTEGSTVWRAFVFGMASRTRSAMQSDAKFYSSSHHAVIRVFDDAAT
jgi:hypothetical protein